MERPLPVTTKTSIEPGIEQYRAVSSSIEQYRAVSSWYRAVSSWYRAVSSSIEQYPADNKQLTAEPISTEQYQVINQILGGQTHPEFTIFFFLFDQIKSMKGRLSLLGVQDIMRLNEWMKGVTKSTILHLIQTDN